MLDCFFHEKTPPQHTLGIDLGDRKHAICIIDQAGEIIQECMVSNTLEDLARLAKSDPDALIAMEVGMHSHWENRFFQKLGHRVLVADLEISEFNS